MIKIVSFDAKIRAITPDGSHVVTVPKQYIKDGSLSKGDFVRVLIDKKEVNQDVEKTGKGKRGR